MGVRPPPGKCGVRRGRPGGERQASVVPLLTSGRILAVISPTADDNQAVAEQIFASKAAGIGTYGNTSRTVVDDQGTSHTVQFTRPTTLDVYIELEIEVDAAGEVWIGGLTQTVIEGTLAW